MVGLTGGIASGKSTVAAMLVERGAILIDADVLARHALDQGEPGYQAALARFGPSIVAADGSIDRPALAAIVFADERARADLNAIVHPVVASGIAARIAELHATDSVVVVDVPLLAETASDYGFEDVIVVSAPADVRRVRLSQSRGMGAEESDGRIAAQASDEVRAKIATIVIDNGGSLEDLRRSVDSAWEQVTTP